MFHLYQVERRLPLSDWIAQVERRLERRHNVQLHKSARAILADYYNVGLSVDEMIDELLDETDSRGDPYNAKW